MKAKPRPELSGIVHRREGRDPRDIGLQPIWKAPVKARESAFVHTPQIAKPSPLTLWERAKKAVGRIFRHQSR